MLRSSPSSRAPRRLRFETRRWVVAVAAVEERHLLKTLRWYDGFVICLANPGFLLGSLGYSVGDLGGWGTILGRGGKVGTAAPGSCVSSPPRACLREHPG